FWLSAPTLQVSIFSSEVTAAAGVAGSMTGTKAMGRNRSILSAPCWNPMRNRGYRARWQFEGLAQCSCDVTAVDSRDIGGGLLFECLVEESLSHVLCRHLAPEQIGT